MLPIGDDNSTRRTVPIVVWTLIAMNAYVWYLELKLGPVFAYGYAAVPYEITHGVDLVRTTAVELAQGAQRIPQFPGPSPIYLSLLSSMFMHGSWMHIVGNMLYLGIFGDQIEDLLGHFRFLIFYLLCGLCAAAAHILLAPGSVVPMLGASGAIAGVLGAYALKFPRNPVRVLMFTAVIPLPAILVLGGWFALQIVAQVNLVEGQSAGIAYAAHIGGFAAGLLMVGAMRPDHPRGER